MKTSENGRTIIAGVFLFALFLGMSGLTYRYYHDLKRYSLGPRALVRKIVSRSNRQRPPWCRSLPAHFTLAGSLKGRRIVQKLVPTYPLGAEKSGVATQVRLKFRVYDNGSVAPNIWVTQMGQPEFDAAAIRALKHWKFTPKHKSTLRPLNRSILNEDLQGEPGSINFTFSLPPPLCT